MHTNDNDKDLTIKTTDNNKNHKVSRVLSNTEKFILHFIDG